MAASSSPEGRVDGSYKPQMKASWPILNKPLRCDCGSFNMLCLEWRQLCQCGSCCDRCYGSSCGNSCGRNCAVGGAIASGARDPRFEPHPQQNFFEQKMMWPATLTSKESQESSIKKYCVWSCWQLSKGKVSRLIGDGPSWLIVAISRAATETCYISFPRYKNNI